MPDQHEARGEGCVPRRKGTGRVLGVDPIGDHFAVGDAAHGVACQRGVYGRVEMHATMPEAIVAYGEEATFGVGKLKQLSERCFVITREGMAPFNDRMHENAGSWVSGYLNRMWINMWTQPEKLIIRLVLTVESLGFSA